MEWKQECDLLLLQEIVVSEHFKVQIVNERERESVGGDYPQVDRSRDVRTFVAGYQCTADNQFFFFQNWSCFSLTFFPFDGKSSALNSTVLIYEYIPTCCFKYTSTSVLPIFSVYNNKVKCCYLVLLYTVCDNLSRTEPNFFLYTDPYLK